jgi:hypothetical protein
MLDGIDDSDVNSCVVLQERIRLELSIRGKLAKIPTISCTADSWTSDGARNYVVILAHGIDQSWQFQSFLLGFIPVEASEDAKFLARICQDQFLYWNINLSQIGLMATDGGSNFKAAVTRELKLPWTHCLAHVLNLVVREVLEHHKLNALFDKAKTLAKHFKVLHFY